MSRKNIIRIAVITVAVACIGIGVCSGEVDEVFRKATAICYSCIGIG